MAKMSIYKRQYVWSVQRNIHAKIKNITTNGRHVIYETNEKTMEGGGEEKP